MRNKHIKTVQIWFSFPGSEMMAVDDDEQSRDLLHCEEHFSSSPTIPTSDTYIEYDDLPELQQVPEETPLVFQMEAGVSHQELTSDPDTQRLTQLALIATGPQSPLLQETTHGSSSSFKCNRDLHSYARPLPEPHCSLSPSRGCGRERRPSRTSSECGSAVSTRSSLSDDEDMGWNFSWPPTVWHCFIKGTWLRFLSNNKHDWQDIEDLKSDKLSEEEEQTFRSYGSEGLQLMEHSETVSCDQPVLELTFNPGPFGHSFLTARCQLDHPFYVKNKGWSSFHPSLTVVHYGIPCYDMEVGDVCLPPGHRDAKHTDDSPVLDTFRSYSFTPLDSSAVYVLSSMARRRRESQSSSDTVSLMPYCGKYQSPSHSPHHKPNRGQNTEPPGSNVATSSKSKRPMNAFMLFAKKYRVQYTQMYPGKDNRSISVLLGERWKKLCSEERRIFTVQAKALADEQRRINPDCWKRKRTNSVSANILQEKKTVIEIIMIIQNTLLLLLLLHNKYI
uniref:HMG box-containing protein 1 n=1 Tax=Periophthalmus magnuspinnatus TaxID=409849 RepID=A0A3B3ZY70_9GOBI